jgi:hypothetical protein
MEWGNSSLGFHDFPHLEASQPFGQKKKTSAQNWCFIPLRGPFLFPESLPSVGYLQDGRASIFSLDACFYFQEVCWG